MNKTNFCIFNTNDDPTRWTEVSDPKAIRGRIPRTIVLLRPLKKAETNAIDTLRNFGATVFHAETVGSFLRDTSSETQKCPRDAGGHDKWNPDWAICYYDAEIREYVYEKFRMRNRNVFNDFMTKLRGAA